MKASDEKASRCDHANGNQYTHLWLWSRVWGNEIPIKLQGRKNPVGVLSDIAKLALKMIDLYISRFTEKRRRTVQIHKGFFE